MTSIAALTDRHHTAATLADPVAAFRQLDALYDELTAISSKPMQGDRESAARTAARNSGALTADTRWMRTERSKFSDILDAVASSCQNAAQELGLSWEDASDLYSVTDGQIIALQGEAGAAGDSEQWQICEDALDGDGDARIECARVISACQAMID